MGKKKRIAEGIDAILGAMKHEGEDDPRASSPGPSRDSWRKREVRTTLVLDEEIFEKFKALSYWERRALKQTLTEALTQYLDAKGESHVERALDAYRAEIDA